MRAIGGALAVLFVLVVSVLPIHTTETKRGDADILIGEVSGPPADDAWARRSTVEVDLVAGSPVIVEQLRDGFGVPVALPPPSGWSLVETGMSTSDPGSPLVIDASFRQLTFALRPVDGGQSTVRVSVDGRPADEVSVAGLDAVPVQVQSGVTIETATRRFGFRGVELGAGAEIDAWLGPVPLDVVERDDGTSIVRVGTVLLALAGGLWSTAEVVGVALILVLAFIAFGWALLGRRFDETDPSIAVALGAAVPALLLGSLNYVIPVRSAAPVVAVAMLATVVWRWRGTPAPITEAADGFRDLVARAAIPGPLALAVVFVAVPAALTHNTNLGMLQTDIFDYLGVQQTYWSSGIVAAELDWGNGLRSIDSSVRSAVIGWTTLAPMEGFTAVRFTSIVVALITVGGAARALGARRTVATLVQLGVLSVASLTSLWVEGYLSREMFIWIVVPTVAVPMSIVGSQAAERGRTWLALGAIFAWPAALVPPFMVTLVVPAIGLLAAARADGFSVARRRGLLFSAGFLGLLIPNGRWVLNVEKANEYANSVENIGKTFVVPFHADPEFPAASLGLAGFHSNDLSWQGPKVLDGFGGPVTAMLRFSNAVAGSWTTSVVAMMAVALAGVVMWSQADPMRRPRVLGLLGTSFVVALAVPILIDTSWETQSFFVLMWIWTMSALFLIPIVIGASVLRGRAGFVAAVPLLFLMVANLGSSTLEMAMWFSHPQADGARYHHYDVAADVLAVRRLLDRGDVAAQDFRIERPVSVTARDDDDRVLFNHLARDLERDGADCLNCVPDTRNGSVAGLATDRGAAADLVLVIGADHCVTGEPLYEGVLVALCGDAGRGAEPAVSTAAGRP